MALQKSYSNAAFCQESEFYHQKGPVNSQRNFRQSPVGAQTSVVVVDDLLVEEERLLNYGKNVEEQEFYEEVVVDDNGLIKSKKLVVTQTPQGSGYCSPRQQQIRPKTVPKERYAVPPQVEETKLARSLYDDVKLSSGMIHRYAVINAQDEPQVRSKNNRYALIPLNELNSLLPKGGGRYEYISTSPVPKSPLRNQNRYEYIQNAPPSSNDNTTGRQSDRYEFVQNPRRNASVEQQYLSPKTSRRACPSPGIVSPISNSKRPLVPRVSSSRTQRNLSYVFGAKQLPQDTKHTAVVTPICSSPIKSVYNGTTYCTTPESWRNTSSRNTNAGQALLVAAFMMFLCGSVTTGLCFYMISIMGRLYFLDFGVVAGFTCVILGLLGFRSRNVHWLPNRNYISGYLVLSLFSLLTCAGLVVLLVEQPRPGTLLADMTSGAVCGISVLSLLLAAAGVISSYCCKYPPPDNRVEHCSPGLTI
ncbi:uncharacterized protein LOC132705775 [Cylas formicarius]|uniref:uncharacterized protein LOC132705775 n=1 Tax=Cylas formicarius TaxID=197179 RepID=UPI0029584B18|nr:uncharacterized protein LOC132705775 [Cylas formicarius]